MKDTRRPYRGMHDSSNSSYHAGVAASSHKPDVLLLHLSISWCKHGGKEYPDAVRVFIVWSCFALCPVEGTSPTVGSDENTQDDGINVLAVTGGNHWVFQVPVYIQM